MINLAHASGTAATTGSGSLISSLLPLFLLLFFFWLIILRPQTKRLNEHKNMIANLKRGDKVVTDSGIIGQIVKVHDHYFVIRIAENVEIQVLKHKVENVYNPENYKAQANQQAVTKTADKSDKSDKSKNNKKDTEKKDYTSSEKKDYTTSDKTDYTTSENDAQQNK